jgi:hypothetical protein
MIPITLSQVHAAHAQDIKEANILLCAQHKADLCTRHELVETGGLRLYEGMKWETMLRMWQEGIGAGTDRYYAA